MTMQIGIDSFAAAYDDASLALAPSERLVNLVEQIAKESVAAGYPYIANTTMVVGDFDWPEKPFAGAATGMYAAR